MKECIGEVLNRTGSQIGQPRGTRMLLIVITLDSLHKWVFLGGRVAQKHPTLFPPPSWEGGMGIKPPADAVAPKVSGG
ncbi:MAG: hypothetical protein PVF83_09100 [Anaerolineales bacterium]